MIASLNFLEILWQISTISYHPIMFDQMYVNLTVCLKLTIYYRAVRRPVDDTGQSTVKRSQGQHKMLS